MMDHPQMDGPRGAAAPDAAERRRFVRHAIDLPAHIEQAGGSPYACTVLDYCNGGMLLHLAGSEEAGVGVGQPISVRTRLLGPAGSRERRFDGTVVWASGAHLGVAFPKPSPMFTDALTQHDRLAHSAVEPGVPPGGGAERCLAKLRHAAQGLLPAMMRELLVATADALLETADRVSSNAEQQQVFGDLHALDGLRQGDLLVRTVLDKAFEPAAADRRDAGEPGELALVDTDEFERWLEASRLATTLERRFGERLYGLGSRLAALRGGSPGSLAVPFEPQHFAGALRDIARQLELGSITRDLLFQGASRVLGDKLDGLYAELDAVLDKLGAPAAHSERKVSVLRQPARSATPAAADAQPEPRPAEPRSPAAGDGAAVSAPAPAAGPPTVAIDAETLEALLQRERRDRETLARELVGGFTSAPGITESMAGWLKHLEATLLHEAITDPGFFQNSAHPVRGIIDGLAHLQLFRANPDLQPAEDPLRQRVTQLLQPIGDGPADAAMLRAVADAIAELTGEQSRQYQRNVERVVEASEGRDRVRRARITVATELNRRYRGRRVPDVVPQLLEVGWRAVLELACLNAPGKVDRYLEQLARLDAVIALLGGHAVDPEAGTVDRQDLILAIETELSVAAFDPFRRNAVETRLRGELLGTAGATPALVEMPVLDEQEGPSAAASRPEGVSAQVWQRVLEGCAAIRVGDRLHFAAYGGKDPGARELHVAWIRDDRESFALVDHRGLKARDISLAELALGVHQRRISINAIDGRPLSERGIDDILGRMETSLRHLSAHDSLTGLMDRRQFQSVLDRALAMPGRADGVGVLLWVDIDQFRLVNDIHGYDTGDRLLVAVARLLEQARGAKVLGHLGGDRFAVLLPDIGLADGENWANERRAAMREMPFDWHGNATALSLSIGVAGLPAAGSDADALMRSVESALVAAKQGGGNQVYLYREDDPNLSRQKESVRWIVEVDDALVRGELRLRCQPIVPVRPDGGLAPHYEVLLGVASGASQPLPIAEFIEAAERYNRMRAVDRWVAKSVIGWIAAHRDQMPAFHGFAVNLSGQTASDAGFVDFVRQQLQVSGIDPRWLSFEVTETAAVADLSSTAGIVHELKALGCKVALDDFGSGLASYSYLKELPVDWLKIDGVFVRKIAANREDFAVVKSINDIGHFLGKKTIAEYVVDEPTLHAIREIGVDFAQGYAISPPILLDDLPAWVAGN